MCFWELLFLELRAEHTGWRVGSIDTIIKMFNMPAIIFGLLAEYETGHYFNIHYAYHAQPGEICKYPGFRTMEWIFELCDHCYPYWQSLTVDPNNPNVLPEGFELHFPRTMAYLRECEEKATKLLKDEEDPAIGYYLEQLEGLTDEEDIQDVTDALNEVRDENKAESDRLLEFVALKLKQLKHGVKKSVDEMAKLTEDSFDPSNIVLFLLHPIHGARVLRVLLQLANEGSFEYLEDTPGEMKWRLSRDDRAGFEKAVYEILKGKQEQVIKSLQVHGLCQLKCREEMKLLSHEGPEVRSNKSSKRLQEFHSDYPQIFDCLHSWFARSMSNTRPVEGAHGFQRSSWDYQRSFLRNDSQLAYLMRIEHGFRYDRRGVAYSNKGVEEGEFKGDKKAAAKHCDTKDLAIMAGNQLYDWVKERYTDAAIKARYTPEELAQCTIKKINKRGMRFKDELFADNREQKSKESQEKRRSGSQYIEPYYEEYVHEARAEQTDHDRHWADFPQQERASRAGRILVKDWWKKVPKDMFIEELENVLPNFFEHLSILPEGKKDNRNYILRPVKKKNQKEGEYTAKNNLGMYVAAVKKIAKRTMDNDLMSPEEVTALADKSNEDILDAFVKVDESKHLPTTMQDENDNLDRVRDLMRENGRQVTDHEAYQQATTHEFTQYLVDFEHTHPGDDASDIADNVEAVAYWEQMEEVEDNEEQAEDEGEEGEDEGNVEQEMMIDDRDEDEEMTNA